MRQTGLPTPQQPRPRPKGLMLDPALGLSGTFLSPAMMYGWLEHLLPGSAEPGFQLLSAGLKITAAPLVRSWVLIK